MIQTHESFFELTIPDAKADKFLSVSIWRGDKSDGCFHDYQVPYFGSQTILDVVSWVQRKKEPGLAYRFACRVGMCGSCAMMVNGKPMWTCRTHVDKAVKRSGKLTIEPLRNLPVIKDLACDMSEFFEKWQKAEAKFHPTKSRFDAIEPVQPGGAKRRAADEAIECINCAICYAACDVVSSNNSYLGPAALNRAWSLANDERDGGNDNRLSAVTSEGGCQNCHSQQGCASYCPNGLNPTRSIAGLKRMAASAALKGKI